MTLRTQLNSQLRHAGITILGAVTPEYSEILTVDSLNFLAKLHRNFNGRRLELLRRRELRQSAIDGGELPNFLAETEHVRQSDDWKGPPPAPGLTDRRVEITGPVDRKMVINALNSGANAFMADFEGKKTNKQTKELVFLLCSPSPSPSPSPSSLTLTLFFFF